MSSNDDFIGCIGLIVLAIFVIPIVLIGSHWKTAEGEKIGVISKISQEGKFFTTNEAELIRGSLNNGSGAFSSIFKFTIPDSLMSSSNQYFENNKEVIVHYKKYGFCPISSDSGCYFATDIKGYDKK